MVNEPFDHDDDGWPDPHVLAAWRVPTLPDEFADRVLAQAQFSPRVQPRARMRSHAPWIAGIAAALAMAAVLLLVFAVRSDRPVPPPVTPMQEPAAEPSVAGGLEIPTVTTSPLVLDVAPADATVIVDGHAIGGSTPFVVHHLAMGPHVVDVRRVGFVPRVEIIHIEGVPRRMALELAPLDVAAETLPPGPTAVRKDPRKPDLRRDLKDPFEGRRADDVGAGRSQDLMDPFSKKPALPAKRTATLRIGVIQGFGPAAISIDGVAVGTTPIANARVTPGVHRIRWDWDDGHSFEQRIEIRDGETKLLKAAERNVDAP
jgi:hypothetical protein